MDLEILFSFLVPAGPPPKRRHESTANATLQLLMNLCVLSCQALKRDHLPLKDLAYLNP